MGIMRMLVGLAIVLAAFQARADWLEPFAKFTCVPETGYLEIEARLVDSDGLHGTTAVEGDPAKLRAAWAAQGFHRLDEATDLECTLPAGHFHLHLTRDEFRETGQCAQDPQVRLTLRREGSVWLDDVVFAEDCFGGPAITRFSLVDDLGGRREAMAELCILPTSFGAEDCTRAFGDRDFGKLWPLSRDDLARWADAAPKTEPRPGVDLPGLVTGPCGFPDLALPKDVVVAAVAAPRGDGRALGYQIDESGNEGRRIDVVIDEPAHPVALLLAAVDPTAWIVHAVPGSQLAAVLAVGADRQVVILRDSTAPLIVSDQSGRHGACEPLYPSSGTADNLDSLTRDHASALARKAFGRTAERIDRAGTEGIVRLGSGTTAAATPASLGDVSSEALRRPGQKLAGKPALLDAVALGVLRKARWEDWRAWEKGAAALPDPPLPVSPINPVLQDAYVVLQAFELPPGELGGIYATFLVPPGVPVPRGDIGRRVTVVEFASHRCTGDHCDRPVQPIPDFDRAPKR